MLLPNCFPWKPDTYNKSPSSTLATKYSLFSCSKEALNYETSCYPGKLQPYSIGGQVTTTNTLARYRTSTESSPLAIISPATNPLLGQLRLPRLW